MTHSGSEHPGDAPSRHKGFHIRPNRMQFRPVCEGLERRSLLASFQGLGSIANLPGETMGDTADVYASITGISADGTTVIGDIGGNSNGFGARWDVATHQVQYVTPSGVQSGFVYGVSNNGSVISIDGFNGTAYQWTKATGEQSIGATNFAGGVLSISGNGKIIAGLAKDSTVFEYSNGSVQTVLSSKSFPAGLRPGSIVGISQNGTTIAGQVDGQPGTANYVDAYALQNGTLYFLDGGSDYTYSPDAISPDGSYVLGYETIQDSQNNDIQGFIWGPNGITKVGPEFNTSNRSSGYDLYATSNYANIVVGDVLGNSSSVEGSGAIIWDATHGFRNLQSVLIADGLGSTLAGWTLLAATAITPDGNTIAGDGINPEGQEEPWVANLQANTTTTLTANPDPSVFGQSVTLTATVTSAMSGSSMPTGKVTFMDGINIIGRGTLDATGTATFTTSDLAGGDHLITADYQGDGNYTGSAGSVPLTVKPINSLTVVTSNSSSFNYGQSVTFTATVSPSASGLITPSGVVIFMDGLNEIGSTRLVNGTASFITSTLALGNHLITTDYQGDGDYNGSSGSLPVTINATSPIVSPSPPTPTQPINPIVPVAPTQPVPALNQLAWGQSVSPAFQMKVIAIAKAVGTDPSFLMAGMAFETGETFSPTKENSATKATGLIQFLPKTAKALGTTIKALRQMTALEQLDYVYKYFIPYTGTIKNIDDAYIAILYPKAIGKPDTYVVFSRTKSLKAYDQNKGLDLYHNGIITKGEASHYVRIELRKGCHTNHVSYY